VALVYTDLQRDFVLKTSINQRKRLLIC